MRWVTGLGLSARGALYALVAWTRRPVGRGGTPVLAAFLFALAFPAQADSLPLWEVGLGVAPLVMPDYRGSDEGQGYVAPLPYLIYRGEVVRVDRKGVSGRLFASERVKLEISADGGVPVKSDQNGARTGMPDIDPTLEIGPSLEVCLVGDCERDPLAWQFRLPARAVFASDFSRIEGIGRLTHPSLNLDVKGIGPGGGWNLGLSFGPLYASGKYHDYYYRVAQEFATVERPAYDTRGGYSGFRTTLALSKRSDRWWFGGFVRHDALDGAVFDDSPLVRRRHSFMAGFGIARVFARSGTFVEARD